MQTKTVEQILREIGVTRFVRMIVAVTGLAWSFVAMEIILIGFTIPLFGAIWNLKGGSLGLIAAGALIGSFIGSLIWGRLADRLGRRPIFQTSVLWYSVFTALTAASWDPVSLFAFRTLAGIGLGGMLVVDPSLLSEYLPPQVRGRYMVFLDFWWPIGSVIALGLAYYFLQVGGSFFGLETLGAWRPLFLVAAFPAFMAFVLRLLIPESPYYLARAGKLDDAAQVLSRVANRKIDSSSIAREATLQKAPVGDLFKGELKRSTGVTVVSWIALNFSYYGFFLWLPGVLARNLFVETGSIYGFLLLSFIAQFPGYAVAMWLVEVWGRKTTLASFLILGGLSGYVFATATTFGSFIAALFLVSFFNLGAWGAVYPYTTEMFPTVLRGTAFGLAEGVGKITAILGPTIFGLLLDLTGSVMLPLTSIAALMAVGGLMVAVFGKETKGRPMI